MSDQKEEKKKEKGPLTVQIKAEYIILEDQDDIDAWYDAIRQMCYLARAYDGKAAQHG